jgi:ABC-type nitrate/sulfonate/bicarbonate transport system ATPase subunit
MVTHSIEEAAYLAGSTYVMRGRNPGRMAAAIAAPAGAPRGPSFRSSPEFFAYASEIRRVLFEGDGAPEEEGDDSKDGRR